MGIAGILGGLSMLGAFSWAFYQALFLHSITLSAAFAFVAISLTGGVAVIIIGLKIFPKTALGKSMILRNEQTEEEGYVGTQQGLETYLGEIGEALTQLRPSGYAKIKDDKIDVVADGEFIEKGEKVKVIKVEENKVYVQKVGEEREEKEEKNG